MLRSKTDGEHAPSAPSALIFCSLLALGFVAALLSTRAIVVATTTHGMLPRWDLAAHLVNGWTPYDHLVHGRLAAFLWEIWSQGYWPPGQSLFQIPFYALRGGAIDAGLHSSAAALVISGLCAVLLLGHVAGHRAWRSAPIALALMVTSPLYLAYGSVAMSEMVGAMAQLLVLVAYAHYARSGSAPATRWLAVALTFLFFVKYNYFVLLAGPLLCHQFLTHTARQPPAARARAIYRTAWSLLTTPPGAIAAGYVAVVVAIVASGGFAIDVAGQRLAFRTVGYAFHPLLYGALFYLWRTHRQGRWNWPRMRSRDPRLRPFVLWFVLPVVIWLASPYPNHIKDVTYLVVNIPMGQPSTQHGLTAYLTAVGDAYFAHPALAVVALAGFVMAVARYRAQCALGRLLTVTAALQIAMVTVHHTRDARFMLLAMPPFWIVSAHQLGTLLLTHRPRLTAAVGLMVLACAAAGAAAVTAGENFTRVAAMHYVHSPALAAAFAAVRTHVPPDARVAVVGRSDAVSPALVRLQLGPASGGRRRPDEIARASDVAHLRSADWIVRVDPSEVATPPAATWIAERAGTGVLLSSCVFPIPDLGVTLQVWRQGEGAAARPATGPTTGRVCD